MFRLVNHLRAWVERIQNRWSFQNSGGIPPHPHWAMVQWGYVAVIFMALLVTMMPKAIGSPSATEAKPKPLEAARSEACYVDVKKSDTGSSRCELEAPAPLLDWATQSKPSVPSKPLQPRNERG